MSFAVNVNGTHSLWVQMTDHKIPFQFPDANLWPIFDFQFSLEI